VAIVANPVFYQVTYTRRFTEQEGLANVPNWLYLTGPVSTLAGIWKEYGIDVEVEPGGNLDLVPGGGGP
jgi:hypothetical protein